MSSEAQLEIMVGAALDGHDLTGFEPLDQIGEGYQARCRNCDKTVWVGDNGLVYSMLGDECGGSSPQSM